MNKRNLNQSMELEALYKALEKNKKDYEYQTKIREKIKQTKTDIKMKKFKKMLQKEIEKDIE